MADEENKDQGEKGQGGKENKDKLSFSDIMRMKAPVLRSVTIQLNGGLSEEIESVRRELSAAESRSQRGADDAGLGSAPEVQTLQARLDQLEEEGRESEVVFTFQSLSRPHIQELLRRCPPTPQQKKNNPDANVNEDEYMPLLICHASYEPKINEQEAKDMFSSGMWSSGELIRLFVAADSANSETSEVPFTRPGIGRTRRSG